MIGVLAGNAREFRDWAESHGRKVRGGGGVGVAVHRMSATSLVDPEAVYLDSPARAAGVMLTRIITLPGFWACPGARKFYKHALTLVQRRDK